MAEMGGFRSFTGTRSGDKVAPIAAIRGPRWSPGFDPKWSLSDE
jgi:hypothetical protein